MDTDATRVVRGDGTETGEGRETITETPPEATRVGSYRKLHPPRYQSPTPSLEEPSWGSMYASTSSDDEGDFGDGAVRMQPVYTPPSISPSPTPSSCRPSLTKAPSFSRLRATFTAIADVASVSASSTLNIPVTTSPLSSSPSSPTRRRHRMSSISMTSSSEAPPEPTIRRSQRSHPDITSLCKSWSASGPANQTTTYKPDVVSKRGGDFKHECSFTRS